jgi:hypothetical protein
MLFKEGPIIGTNGIIGMICAVALAGSAVDLDGL